jgi:hypothetical protein
MFQKIIVLKELSAGVAQLGQSVRLIIERPRAQVPPPARNHKIQMILKNKELFMPLIF